MTGPGCLLRVYAPYLGHAEDRVINYIAIEPVIQGSMTRSFSEFEVSQLDGIDDLPLLLRNGQALSTIEPYL